MPLCEKCQAEMPQKVYKPGCPQCVRAFKLAPECRECIQLGNGYDAFPRFEQAVKP